MDELQDGITEDYKSVKVMITPDWDEKQVVFSMGVLYGVNIYEEYIEGDIFFSPNVITAQIMFTSNSYNKSLKLLFISNGILFPLDLFLHTLFLHRLWAV